METFFGILGIIGIIVFIIWSLVCLIRKKKARTPLIGFCISVIFFIIAVIIPNPTTTTSSKQQKVNSKTSTSKKAKTTKNDVSQEELDAKLKSEAVKADFVEINGDNWYDKKVYTTGEVSFIDNSKNPSFDFMLTTDENDGHGIYQICSFNTLPSVNTSIKNGDTVTVYGTVDKRQDDGTPTILCTVVEKHEDKN